MIILREVTKYTKSSLPEIIAVLADGSKAGKHFQAHLGSNGISSMESRYDKLRISGNDLTFIDSRTQNRLFIRGQEVAGGEIGTDPGVDFITVRLDFKARYFISISLAG